MSKHFLTHAPPVRTQLGRTHASATRSVGALPSHARIRQCAALPTPPQSHPSRTPRAHAAIRPPTSFPSSIVVPIPPYPTRLPPSAGAAAPQPVTCPGARARLLGRSTCGLSDRTHARPRVGHTSASAHDATARARGARVPCLFWRASGRAPSCRRTLNCIVHV